MWLTSTTTPSISSEYMKFLATNLGFEQMETVQKELASVVKSNKELHDCVEKFKKVAEQATSVAGKVKKALDAMGRQIQSLEKRLK